MPLSPIGVLPAGVSLPEDDLTPFKKKTKPKARNLVNLTFGRLRVLERDAGRGRGYWRLQCTALREGKPCGAFVTLSSDSLLRDTHPTVCDWRLAHDSAEVS